MAKPGRGRPATPSGSGSGSSPSRSRSRSSTGSDSRSSSRSRSRSRSSSSSPSRTASSRSRSPPPQRKSILISNLFVYSPAEGPKRGRSPPLQSKKTSPPPRKTSPIPESRVLHVDQLSRNVNEAHLKEIFIEEEGRGLEKRREMEEEGKSKEEVMVEGMKKNRGGRKMVDDRRGNFGEVVNVRLVMDHAVNLSRGFGYVEFKIRTDAEKALAYMDGGQIDGNVVRAKFTLPERKKVSPPPKVVPTVSKRDAPKIDNVGADVEKDGPKRQREPSPRRKPHSPLRRRSPIARRGGSPRREPDSPLRRRVDSPVRRRGESPYHRGETPPRRRPASPGRGRSPSSPPRRNRSPARASPRRIRGSPIRRRSPIPPRRRVSLHAVPPLLDELEVRPEGLLLIVDAAALLFEGLCVHVQDQSLHGEVEHQFQGVGGRHLTQIPLVHARSVGRRVSRSRSPRRPLRGRSTSNSSSSSSPPPPRKP
ncbi:hypothetical protein HYC85_011491 [Camellia sinensis]|uniref:RRM domain-containing protein n=1 Tax=Camellia sinensis TaxID=4442 RepID=A0A7J7HCB2_CAMSI|nr:hypothetical protein HYC85_011491 [Camellia sinensis]